MRIASVDFLGGQIAVNARVLEDGTRELLVDERAHGPESSASKLYDEIGLKLTEGVNKHLARRVTMADGDSADSIAVNEHILLRPCPTGSPGSPAWFWVRPSPSGASGPRPDSALSHPPRG